ncbi:MAG TPA: hypothetical protein VMJ32_13410 [Pirellulales bacterium]|nr:hypothetical protein [Pirellulales bacterium]
MHHRKLWSIALALYALYSCRSAIAQTKSDFPHAHWAGINFPTGWSLLREGEAAGTIEQDAKHPQRTSPHLLHISVTKTADSGKGRAGATNSTPIDVYDDHWYDISFSAVTEGGSIGLVFSLETAEGKVLARTTLPEIGHSERDNPDTPAEAAASPWRNYTVSLHARGTDSHAHLVITPIEPTSIWLDDLKLTPRTVTPSSAK